MPTLPPNDLFVLTQERAEAINALLPDCKYVVGIRENETGEVHFCPQTLEWNDASLSWWESGNMSCDCNRELMFVRQKEGWDWDTDDLKCSDGRFTVVGIWFPGGSEIRDLNQMNDL